MADLDPAKLLAECKMERILQTENVRKVDLDLEKFSGSAEEAAEKLEELVKKMEEAYKNELENCVEQLKNAKLEEAELKKARKNIRKSLNRFATEMTSELLKRTKKMTGSDNLRDNVASAAEKANRNLRNNFRSMAPSITTSASVKTDPAKTWKTGEQEGRVFGQAWMVGMSHYASTLATMLLGGTDLYAELIKGFPDAAMLYHREMKKNLYLTDGLTNKTGLLVNEYENLIDAVEIAGYGQKEMQKSMTIMVSRGFKNAKLMKGIAVSSLNTANMMGLSASESLVMTELFADWNQHFGMSLHQLGAIGSGMKDISRTSGLTGQNLLVAVKNSEQFLEVMRKTGQLTASAANNMMSISASLQKRGVLNDANSLMANLTSPTKILSGQGGTEGALMAGSAARAGLTKEFFSGTIAKSRKDLSGFFGAFQTDLERMFNVSFDDLDKLDPQMKAIINASLEQQGMQTLDTYKRIFDGVKEATKPLSKTMAEYDKEVNSLNASLKTASGVEKRRIEQEILSLQEKKMSATSAASAAASQEILDIVTKSGANYKAGIADKAANGGINNAIEDLTDMMSKMGNQDLANQISAGNSDAILKATAITSAKALKDLGGADMTKDLLKAIDSQDPTLIQKGLEDVSRRIAIMNKDRKLDNTSPIDKLLTTINKLNTVLVTKISGPLNAFFGMIGATGLAAIYLGLVGVSTGLALLGTILTGFVIAKGTGGILKWLFPNFRADVDALKVGSSNFTKTVGEGFNAAKVKSEGFFKGLQKSIWGTVDSIEHVWHPDLGIETRKVPIPTKGIVDKIFDLFNKPLKLPKWQKLLAAPFIAAWDSLRFIFGSFKSVGSDLGSGFKKLKDIMFGTKESLVLVGEELTKVSATKGLFKVMWEGAKTGWSGLATITKNGFFGIVDGIIHPIKTMKNSFVLLKDASKLGAKGIQAGYKSFSTFMKTSTLGTMTPVFMAIDGVFGAFSGFSNAGKNFEGVLKASGKSLDDVTTSMKISGAVGGALWGVIDGIFLGLPGLLLWMVGLGGQAEKLFTFMAHSITVFVEGIWEGIKEGFAFWAPYFNNTWEKIKKQFSNIAGSFIDIWNKIGKAFGLEQVTSMEQIFTQIWSIVKPMGKVIGQIVGYGFVPILVGLFEVLSFGISIIEGVVKAISGVIDAIMGVVKVLFGAFQLLFSPIMATISGIMAFADALSSGRGLKDAFQAFFVGVYGYMKDAVTNVVSGVGEILGGLVSAVYDFFSPMVKWILDFFDISAVSGTLSGSVDYVKNFFVGIYNAASKWLEKAVTTVEGWFIWLWDTLVGHSIIPDIVNGIIDWFSKLPQKIIPGLMYLGKKMLEYIASIPGKMVIGLLGIADAFVKTVTSIPSMMWKGLEAIGEAAYNAAPDWLRGIFDGLVLIGTAIEINVLKPFREFIDYVTSGKLFTDAINKVTTLFEDNIINPLMSGFASIKLMFLQGINTINDAFEDFVYGLQRSLYLVSQRDENALKQNRQARDSQLIEDVMPQKWTDEGSSTSGGSFGDDIEVKPNVIIPPTTNLNDKLLNESVLQLNSIKNCLEQPKNNNINTSSTTLNEFFNKSKVPPISKSEMEEVLKKALKNQEQMRVKDQRPDSLNIEDTTSSIEKLTKEATEKHSIYTHDTHVEKALNGVKDEQEKEGKGNTEPDISVIVDKAVANDVEPKTPTVVAEAVIEPPSTKQRYMTEYKKEHTSDKKYASEFAKRTDRLDNDAESYAVRRMLKEAKKTSGTIIQGELVTDKVIPKSQEQIPNQGNNVIQTPEVPKTTEWKAARSTPRTTWDVSKVGEFQKEFADNASAKALGLSLTDKNWDSLPNQFQGFSETYEAQKKSLLEKKNKDPKTDITKDMEQLDKKKGDWNNMMNFYHEKTEFKEFNPIHDMLLENHEKVKDIPTSPNMIEGPVPPAFTQPKRFVPLKLQENISPEKRMNKLGEPSTGIIKGPSTGIHEPRFLTDTLLDADEARAKVAENKTATTLPETDVLEQSLKKRNDENPSGTVSTSRDFAALISVNEDELAELEEIKEGIQELIGIFDRKTSGSGATSVSTKSNIIPAASPDFYRWQYGNVRQNPNKDIVTTGV